MLLRWGVGTPWRQVQNGPAELDPLMTLCAAALAWACLSWLTLAFVLALLTAVPGTAHGALTRVAAWVTPPVVRRASVTLLGLAVAVPATAAAAGATTPAPDSGRQPTVSAASQVRTGPLPNLDRPIAGRPPLTDPVAVRPGDTLWAIAARTSPVATDAAVRRSWPRWYAANRAAIGPDPDLIRPGQHLRPPYAPFPAHEHSEEPS
jgi:hypothetical protein